MGKYQLEKKLGKFEEDEDLVRKNATKKDSKNSEQLVAFARRICECLDDKGLNQSDLVRGTKIGKASINAYVKVEQTPNIQQLVKIAKFFNVSTDYMLGLTDFKNPKEDYKTVNKITGLDDEVISILNECNKSGFGRNLISTINFLIKQENPFSKELTDNHTQIISMIHYYLATNIGDKGVHLTKESTSQKGVLISNLEQILFSNTPIDVEKLVDNTYLKELEFMLRQAKPKYLKKVH